MKEMEIRSLEVDIDKGILKINGQDVKEPTIVTLPGPEGWPLQRLFASSTDAPVECKRISILAKKPEESVMEEKKEARNKEISEIFSQRMRGFNAQPDDLASIIKVIEAMKDCTIEQAEAILEDASKIIKIMTKIK